MTWGIVNKSERKKIIEKIKSNIEKKSPVKTNKPFIKRRPPQKRIYWSGGFIPNTSIKNPMAENKSIIPRILRNTIVF